MNKDILIIVCYFGKLPWYYPYFLHSCKHNPSIDFLIFADSDCPIELTPNIQFVKFTMDDMKGEVRNKLDIELDIAYAYKICDLKPAYGVIFSEYISEYKFWGHGDMDVIFGNIRNFLTPEILDTYDSISVRHDFLTGYFQLYRNTPFVNRLFEHSKDYQKVFSSRDHYCFDETNFHFVDFTGGMHYSEVKSEVESMTHVVKRLAEEGKIKAHFDMFAIEGNNGKLRWRKGTLVYRNKFEAILYHLIKLKTVYNPPAPPRKVYDEFRISSSKIYT